MNTLLNLSIYFIILINSITSKQQLACVSSDNGNVMEIMLQCSSDQYIHINWAFEGVKSIPDNDNCEYDLLNDCISPMWDLSDECNGKQTCELRRRSMYLHTCASISSTSKQSNFIVFDYDCLSRKNTINICGKSLNNYHKSKEDNVVYLQSPNYPMNYPNSEELCRLNISSSKSNDRISFITKELQLEDSRDCFKDYLKINNKRYCSSRSKNSLLQIAKEKKSVLEFATDNVINQRGFLLELHSNNDQCTEMNYKNLYGNFCYKISNDDQCKNTISITHSYQLYQILTEKLLEEMTLGNLDNSQPINTNIRLSIKTDENNRNNLEFFNLLTDERIQPEPWWPILAEYLDTLISSEINDDSFIDNKKVLCLFAIYNEENHISTTQASSSFIWYIDECSMNKEFQEVCLIKLNEEKDVTWLFNLPTSSIDPFTNHDSSPTLTTSSIDLVTVTNKQKPEIEMNDSKGIGVGKFPKKTFDSFRMHKALRINNNDLRLFQKSINKRRNRADQIGNREKSEKLKKTPIFFNQTVIGTLLGVLIALIVFCLSGYIFLNRRKRSYRNKDCESGNNNNGSEAFESRWITVDKMQNSNKTSPLNRLKSMISSHDNLLGADRSMDTTNNFINEQNPNYFIAQQTGNNQQFNGKQPQMINGHLLLPWNQNGMVSTLQTRLNSPNESGIYSLEEANNIHNGDNTNHNSKTSKCRLKKFYSIGKGRQSRRDRTQSRNKSCDSSNKNSNENQGINQNQILYKTIRTQSLDNYLSTENNSGNPLAHNVILLNNDGTTFIPQKMPQIALGTIYNGNQLVSYVPQKTQDGNTILVPQPIMNSVVVQNNNQNLEGCNIDNNPNTHTYTQVQPNVSRPAVLPLSAYHSTNMSHLVSSTSANAPPFHLPQTQLNNSSSSDCNSKNSDTSCYDYVTKDFYTIFDKNQNNKQFTEIFHNNNPQATPQNLPNKQMNNPNFNSNDSTESSTETDLFQLSSNSSNKKANENEHVIPLIPSICDDGQSNSKNGNWNKISCEPSIV